MNEVILGDEKLVSTSRAAELSGYSQDYIGQLCRSGGLECRMISDQWYIDPDSLRKYVPDMIEPSSEGAGFIRSDAKNDVVTSNSNEARKAYSVKIGDVRSGAFKYDGEDYIPTQKAAEISGYTQDYIGQLARGGEIAARKVGRRWYIAREALTEHKKEKDAMLRLVQSDASGIDKKEEREDNQYEIDNKIKINTNFDLKYISDDGKPLIPHRADVFVEKNNSKVADIEDNTSKSSMGRFGYITNTHLGYTDNSTSKKEVKQITSIIAPQSINNISKPIKSSQSLIVAKIVPIVFAVVILGLAIIIYSRTENKSISAPLIPAYNVLKSLEEKYGDYLPARTLRYSN